MLIVILLTSFIVLLCCRFQSTLLIKEELSSFYWWRNGGREGWSDLHSVSQHVTDPAGNRNQFSSLPVQYLIHRGQFFVFVLLFVCTSVTFEEPNHSWGSTTLITGRHSPCPKKIKITLRTRGNKYAEEEGEV